MVTITCQYSGLNFEAESKRSKNHPQVTTFLNDANREGRYKVGAYAAAVTILNAAKSQFDSIEDFMAYVNAAFESWKSDATSIHRVTEGDRIRQLKDQKRQRDAVNSVLKSHGYRWEKEGYADEEDADFFAGFASAPIGQYWQLYAPDGRKVSVKQALDEIG